MVWLTLLKCNFTDEDKLIFNKVKVFNTTNTNKNNNNINNNTNAYNSDNNNTKINKKLLCIIYTYSPNHQHISDILHTWGKKCDGFIAFSNLTNLSLSTYAISPTPDWQESYNNMWKKTIFILNIITKIFLYKYDYFIMGGDDMFIIIENLKIILNSHYLDRLPFFETKPVFIGKILKQNKYLFFNSGGPGYILNRVALIRLYNQMKTTPTTCLTDVISSMEDVLVANCLLQAGVEPLPRCHITNILKEVYSDSNIDDNNNANSDKDSNTVSDTTSNDSDNSNSDNEKNDNIYHDDNNANIISDTTATSNDSNNNINNNNNNYFNSRKLPQEFYEEVFHAVSPYMSFSYLDW